MKTLIICHSEHHNNTWKIAKAMAEVLDAKLVKAEEADKEDIRGYELIGFGSGIYNGKHHKSLLKLVEKKGRQEGKKAFIFSTSGARKIQLIHEFEKPLKKRLREKGYTIMGEYNCRGWDTYFPLVKPFGGINKGRPNQKDIENAKKFAEGLKD